MDTLSIPTRGRSGSEPLESIREEPDLPPPPRVIQHKDSKAKLNWPFHHRKHSGAPSSAAPSYFSNFGHFRKGTAQTRSLLRLTLEDSASTVGSIIPDYIVNYIRGETPETLAKKREERGWGRRDVEIESIGEPPASRAAEFDEGWDSTTHLAPRGFIDEKKRGGVRRSIYGWQGGVMLNAVLSFLVLLVTVVFFVILSVKSHTFSGTATIFSGSCVTTWKIDLGLRAVINVLSITLLAGGNYVFQVLSSPTRADITEAHCKMQWLDIGIPSIRNLLHISKKRSCLAIFVLLIPVVIHIIYNSVILTSQDGSDVESALTTCAVAVDMSMFFIVALLNVIALVILVAVLCRPQEGLVVSLGDAIRFFLETPDPTTVNACLLTKEDVNRGLWSPSKPTYIVPTTHRWFATPSLGRWLLIGCSWLVLLAPTAFALGIAMSADPHALLAVFGTANTSTLIRLPAAIATSAQACLLGALPHLLVAALYLATNSLLTTFFFSHEFSLFALCRSPLRVSSDPVGVQTTSLFLTLPRPISWVLLIFFAGLGFALSAAISPVVLVESTTSLLDSEGGSEAAQALLLALSAQPLLAMIGLLVLLALFVAALGVRATPRAALVDGHERGNPLALRGGTCSAVLSAKCPPVAGDYEPWARSVAWGVVNPGPGTVDSRCGFSSLSVGAVDIGRGYA
ncbi:hypothetical protein BX600DRAFT_496012 [Xylariales sp. PMI_506]|nr:hypothetical protein BX600DRAFT_496012 [Xylariales sp. PMI_506]